MVKFYIEDINEAQMLASRSTECAKKARATLKGLFEGPFKHRDLSLKDIHDDSDKEKHCEALLFMVNFQSTYLCLDIVYDYVLKTLDCLSKLESIVDNAESEPKQLNNNSINEGIFK